MDTLWANVPGSRGNAPQGEADAVAVSSAGHLITAAKKQG